MKEILSSRQTEEKEIVLNISVYDSIRNKTVKKGEIRVNYALFSHSRQIVQKLPTEEEKEAHKGEQEESKAADLDYLSPFLVNRVS